MEQDQRQTFLRRLADVFPDEEVNIRAYVRGADSAAVMFGGSTKGSNAYNVVRRHDEDIVTGTITIAEQDGKKAEMEIYEWRANR